MQIPVRSGKPIRQAEIVSGGAQTALAPIGVVGVGTAQANRVLLLGARMGNAGLEDRLQSRLIIDYNQETVSSIKESLKKRLGNGPSFVLPRHLRDVDGYLGIPDRWKTNEGLVILDL